MKHKEILDAIEEYAPYELKESWDPTGPMLGDLEEETTGVLISLDLTFQALELALQNRCNLIITHHPFLFSPIQTVLSNNKEQKLLLELIKHNMTCISAHTNLDAAEEGVAISFLEQSLIDIDYQVTEILIPNEENPSAGHGRVVRLNETLKLSELQNKVDSNLQTVCQTNMDQNMDIRKVVFTPGAFDENWISELEKKQVDLLITGEIKHHVSVMLYERGIALLTAGHGASEQTIVSVISKYFHNKFPEINFVENPGIVYNRLRSE